MAHKIIYVIMEEGRRGDERAARPNTFDTEAEADARVIELAEKIPADLMGPPPRFFIRKLYTK